MTDSMLDLALSTSPRSDIVPRGQLTRRDRDEMFALYTAWFAAGDRMVFERDLAEKQWVILLRDAAGVVDGFSTLMQMEVGQATVFFSGDTIVARHRWSSYDLPRMWGAHVFSHPGENNYWFLISSGDRTYRYLPLFFRNFIPACDRESPAAMKTLLDRVAALKFGEAYDAASGVIRLATPAPLRDTGDPESRAARDPHVRFFLERNPGHVRGDELACLVHCVPENLTRAGLRMIGRR